MINILIPVNNNVTPLYKYYTVFLSKIAEKNINVTLLGIVLSKILPCNYNFYLDNIIVAKNQVSPINKSV